MMSDHLLQSDDELTRSVHEFNLNSWIHLCEHIKDLPYGRNSNRSDLFLVIKERKGTCSSKHAFLKKVAELNGITEVKLMLGIYKMNQINTPKIGNVLKQHSIDFIPEAHCYLKVGTKRFDYTSKNANINKIEKDILEEQEISPEQVASYKVNYHKEFLKKWLTRSKLELHFLQLWQIREDCIRNIEET